MRDEALDVERAQRFGAALERHRLSRGLSRSRLAAMVGMDRSYLDRMVRGQRNPPRRQVVGALADNLYLAEGDRRGLFADAGYLESVQCCPRCAAVSDVDLVMMRVGERGFSFLEAQLVRLLAERMPAFVSRAECCSLLLTKPSTLQPRVCNVRKKLAGWEIQFVSGEGYRLVDRR